MATAQEFAAGLAESSSDPAEVRCPFLTLIGTGKSAHSIRHAERWHEALPVEGKGIVDFDAATGADAHCQPNNPLRMAQELCNWLDELFDGVPER